ncbi:chemotaxis protein CheW [Sphingomonas sp. CGMCC 1.13654]|uniref:Chemotaxis protein CheA n=1 Tax=Sphingomonas chungangi TaxID=2683589 RepID=A0A838LFX1_9SPHN|nr:chemotaxis protein CheW [Sphingomonas chungangi]MBA2936328.1 chemotaxis protein CheW [Sphingomonas chungangi]MVW55713.1 chemotaxis protein CheA [Sphingomonas chungangi]
MEELLGEFIAETRETLEPLAGEIVAWEADPSDRGRLDSIFRFVHTVKGSCGFLDLPRLERLSHAAESALAEVRSGDRTPDRKLVNAVLAIIDRIGEYVEALAAGETYPEGGDEALILALEDNEVEAPEPTPAIVAQQQSTPRAPARSIRLPVELLDRMMAGVSDMVLARNELSRRLRERGGDAIVDTAFERLSACVAEMRESITRTRMQRIDGLFSALPRMVRDLSAELHKQVHLIIDGGDVELDREMIEMIRDPLTHIVRNSIDHGIEGPADRAAAGKAVGGTLRVDARQSGNQILIEIADDGRGIDDEKLLAKALAAGLVTRERAQRMDRQERLELIFAAGLSTAQAVTAISGRGVGMDVVRANVERIGGTVEIDTTLGRGTRLTLRVPMTLTIIPALTFAVGAELFAIPRGAVDEIVRSYGGSVEVEMVGSAPVARIRGERVPVVELAKLLGVPSYSGGRSILVVVRASSGERYALSVDSVQDHEELVVKPAAPAIMATGVYAGTTLPDNGRPMLLIDPAGVAQVAGVRAPDAAIPAKAEAEEARIETVPTLLFRACDHAVRAIRLGLVERIEDVAASAIARVGGRLRLSHDGRILPLFGCDAAMPDKDDRVRVLLLGDGTTEIAYAIGEVIDIHALDPAFLPAAEPGPIAGVMLVGEIQVELVDCFWLFGQAGAGVASPERPLCVLDSTDPWMRDILRPIVEQAGYRVGWSGEGDEAAAIAILSVDKAPAAPLPAASVIRLRATADETAASAGSIYRYDRHGLIAALAAAQGRR